MEKKISSKESIIDLIKNLSFKSPGSGGGTIYQEIPFEEFAINKSRREENISRLKFIEKTNLKDKIILDIGCNIGYFCFKLAEKGAICYGVDYDEDNIKLAQALKEYKNIKRVHFIHSKFDENFIEELLNKVKKVDIIIFYSAIHWLMQEYHDINIIISLFRKLLNPSQIIFYEPSSSDRAFYPDLLKKNEVIKFLRKIGYHNCKYVSSYYVSNLGTSRQIWMASMNLKKLSEKFYKILKLSKKKSQMKILCGSKNFFVKIINVKTNPRLFLINNDINFIKELREKPYVPFFYGSIPYNNYLFYYYERLYLFPLQEYIDYPPLFSSHFKRNITKIEFVLFKILDDFKRMDIIHRDLNPTNILINKDGSQLKIVDFEFAIKNFREIIVKNNKDKNYLSKSLKNICTPQYRSPGFETLSFDIDRYTIKKVILNVKKINYKSFRGKLLIYLKNKKYFFFYIKKIFKFFDVILRNEYMRSNLFKIIKNFS